MGYTQLKIGVQGGHMKRRGETEVKVVQNEESGEDKKTKKARGKTKNKKQICVLVPRTLTKIDRPAEPRKLSESTFGPHVPQERVYMDTRGQLVYYIGTLFSQECAQTTFCR
jgi:hypothetical protein